MNIKLTAGHAEVHKMLQRLLVYSTRLLQLVAAIYN